MTSLAPFTAPATACVVTRVETSRRLELETVNLTTQCSHPFCCSFQSPVSKSPESSRSCNRASVPDRQPVGPHPIPLLNHQSLLLEHKADLARIATADSLENRNQHAQRVVADHGATGD